MQLLGYQQMALQQQCLVRKLLGRLLEQQVLQTCKACKCVTLVQANPPMTSQQQIECKTYDAAGWLAAGAAASELGACAQTCGVRIMLGLSDK